MAISYDLREGEVAAVDTKTALSTQGSNSSPGAMLVPAGKTKIAQIITAAGFGFNDDDADACVLFIRLEGNGMVEQQVIPIASASCGTGAELGEPFALGPNIIPVDFDVKPGNQIQIYAEVCGSDVIVANASVTLGFI